MDIQECIIGYSYEWIPNNQCPNNRIPKIPINHEVIKLKKLNGIEDLIK